MIPVYQTINEDSENTGNCLQAAIASVLEMPIEKVPHFSAMGEYWMIEFMRWCEQHGFVLVTIDSLPPFGVYAIVGGPSPRGDYTHAVVFGPSNEMVHDPHPSGDGLADGDRWCYLFVPVDPSSLKNKRAHKSPTTSK